MRPFPKLLSRVAGLPIDVLHGMNFNILSQDIKEISKISDRNIELKRQLCDKMLEFMKCLRDSKKQNVINNLRKDIWNDREPKEKTIDLALDELPSYIADEYHEFQNHVKALGRARLIYNDHHKASTLHARIALRSISEEEIFRSGLLLSSRSFLDSLRSYTNKNIDTLTTKDLKIEGSLLKYITRSSTKTSPFSTFGNTLFATATEKLDSLFKVNSIEGSSINGIRSSVRLNNILLPRILEPLLVRRSVYRKLRITLNQSLERYHCYVTFLINRYNVESFQRIERVPILDLILDYMDEGNDTQVYFKDLVDRVKVHVNSTKKEIELYLRNLVEIGLINFDLRVSGLSRDWDSQLINSLKYYGLSHESGAKKVIRYLRAAKSALKAYEHADTSERERILDLVYEEVLNLFAWFESESSFPGHQASDLQAHSEEINIRRSQKQYSIAKERLIYEDTSITGWSLDISAKSLGEFANKLVSLFGGLESAAGNSIDQTKLLEYFLSKFPLGKKIPFLQFYHEYYLDKKNESLQSIEGRTSDSSDIITASQVSAPTPISSPKKSNRSDTLTNTWRQEFAKRVSTSGSTGSQELHFDISLLKQINDHLEIGHKLSPHLSLGMFIQFYEQTCENGQRTLMGVLNSKSTFAGYGKMLSRFLDPESSITEAVKEWNRYLIEDGSIYIEACDGSYSNANLHPPLLPFEVSIPGGHNMLPEENRIPVGDLYIEMVANGGNKELAVFHKSTNKRVFVFDLGFQGHMGRSPLFQLLQKFSRVKYIYTSTIPQALSTAMSDPLVNNGGEDLQIIPRIIFENQIILQRKTWMVSKAILPSRVKSDSDSDYFLKVETWRIALDIPDEVFVFLASKSRTREKLSVNDKLTKDDYKPQYINFTNPLLVQFFGKILDKVDAVLKIEEMLPSSKDTLKIKQKSFVTEYLFQLYP